MEVLFIIPAFFVFLYCFYKLIKDDYIFIRKGISLEQMFDVIFSVSWISIFVSRFFYYLFHPIGDSNLLAAFFSVQRGGFSLLGAVVGGIISMYLFAKYKKIPLGRLFDFVSLAFLISLPFGFAAFSFAFKGEQFYMYMIQAVTYLLLTVFFMKSLYPRLMSRNLKEGTLTNYFFLIYFTLSLASSIAYGILHKNSLATLENMLLVCFFIMSCIFIVRHDRSNSKSKRS